MAISTTKGTKVCVIDRTLAELLLIKPNGGKYRLMQLCDLLKAHGSDVFEIDRRLLARFKWLPPEHDFICRVESESDVGLLNVHGLRRCIVRVEHAEEGLLKRLRAAGVSVALELSAAVEAEVDAAVSRALGMADRIAALRITGLERVESFGWMDRIRSRLSGSGIAVDICPSDRLFMATAIALEAVQAHTDYLSVTFGGVGKYGRFAALEEVLLAAYVLRGAEENGALKTVPQTAAFLEKSFGIRFCPIKPVIGKNIFNVESGLHVDAIQKHPETYELFNPELIGQQRVLTVGKHSGKASIVLKLKEMGIACDAKEAQSVLKAVRDKSIQLGRNLNNQEAVRLYNICTRKENMGELIR